MTAKYILDGKVPVKEDDLLKWIRWFEEADNRQVAQTILDDVKVSTVFVGLDYSFGVGPPVTFGTLVSSGDRDGFERHYSTWEEAEAGHKAIVKMIGEGDHALDE